MSARRGSRRRSGPQDREAHRVGMTVRPWSYLDNYYAPFMYSKPKPTEGGMAQGTQFARHKGALANLLSMPLEITFYIFSLLKPRDVLYLSWTSKAFHDILSRHSAAWVWKTAREHEPGLPPPPSDLNEAQYACLMFDYHCQICHQKVLKVQWVARVRCCNKCAGKPGHFIMARTFNQFLPQDLIQPVADALPSFPDPRPARRYNVPALYRKTEVRAFSKAIMAIRADKEKVKAMLDERSAALDGRYKEAPRYEQWLLQERVDDAYTSANLRELRYEAVLDKLEELGWGYELQEVENEALNWPGKLFVNLEFLRKHPSVNQKKELTDRIWKNCRDGLVSLMEWVKEDRKEAIELHKVVERERLAKPVWYEYVQTQPWSEALPSVADVCETGPFRELIHEDLDVEVTAADFKDLTAQLPKFCEEWRAHARAVLLDLLPLAKSSGKGRRTKRSKTTVDVAALDRATTFFLCTKCDLPATTEEAMVHGCAVERCSPTVWPLDPFMRDPYINPFEWDTDLYRYHELKVSPWNYHGVFEFDEKASTKAKDIVRLCGLDPEHADLRDLNSLGIRLICEDCSKEDVSTANCMTWRCAVHHVWKHQDHRMRLLSEDDNETVKALEEKELRIIQKNSRSSVWTRWEVRCKHCRACVSEWGWSDHKRKHELSHSFKDNTFEWKNMPAPWPVRFLPENTEPT